MYNLSKVRSFFNNYSNAQFFVKVFSATAHHSFMIFGIQYQYEVLYGGIQLQVSPTSASQCTTCPKLGPFSTIIQTHNFSSNFSQQLHIKALWYFVYSINMRSYMVGFTFKCARHLLPVYKLKGFFLSLYIATICIKLEQHFVKLSFLSNYTSLLYDI